MVAEEKKIFFQMHNTILQRVASECENDDKPPNYGGTTGHTQPKVVASDFAFPR